MNKKVSSPCLPVGDRSLTVAEYPAFFDTLGGVLEGIPTGDSYRFAGRLQCSHGQCHLEICDWEEQPPRCVLLLDFCASYSLSIT